MADPQLDPARLQGNALQDWYRRSSEHVDRERQATAAQRFRDFFQIPDWDDGNPELRTRTQANLNNGTYPGSNGRPPSFISSLFGGPVPVMTPAGNVVGYYDHQAAKAGLDITAKYAGIAPLFQPAGWLDTAIAEGGPVAAKLLLRKANAPIASAPLPLLNREISRAEAAAQEYANALSDAAKNALRRGGRNRFAQASGKSAADMGAQVHHSDPLEFAHLKLDADPNRLANLWAIPTEAHQIASNEWAAFRAALKGRIPSQAEIMATKLKIERMIAPYIVRSGVSRPGPRPK